MQEYNVGRNLGRLRIMTPKESVDIKKKIDQVIAFIKWRGMPIQKKENAIIGKLSAIRSYCDGQTTN